MWLGLLFFLCDMALAEPRGLVAPTYIDKQYADTIWVYPSQRALRKDELLRVLKPNLNPKVFSQLETLETREGLLNFEQLQPFGIKTTYDPNKLELHLHVAPENRQGGEAIVEEQSGRQFKPVRISPSSGQLIFHGNEDFLYGTSESITRPRQFTGALNFVQNFNGTAFETGVDYYDYLPDEKHRRQDTKISSEILQRQSWIEVGDIVPANTGLQTTFAMGGANFSRSRRIKSYRLFRATKDQELFLKRPSSIEVYIADFLYLKTQAPAGPFSLKDIPLNSGINKIRIKIIDDVGQIEEIDASTLLDAEILKADEWDYTFAAGLPIESRGADRAYLNDRQSYSAYVNRGFKNFYQLGLNSQGQSERTLTGVSAAKLFKPGLITADVAARMLNGNSTAFGSQLRWTSKSYEVRKNPMNWYVSTKFQDATFRPVNEITATTSYRRMVELGASQSFGRELLLALNTRNEYPDNHTDPIRHSYYVSVSRDFDYDWRGEASYQASQDSQFNYTLMFNLIWRQTPKLSTTASYTAPTDNKRLAINYEPDRRVASPRVNASIEESLDYKQANAQVRYLTERSELGLEHNTNQPKESDGTANDTKLKLGMGLYWADGVVGVGRPTQDSFALVTSSDDLNDYTLPINDKRVETYAEVDHGFAAVVPNLPSYSKQLIVAEYTSLPDGFSLEQSSFTFTPEYKSGTHIHLVGKGTVMVIGSLYEKNQNTPVELIGGEVVSLDREKESSVPFFTNSKGRFVIEGLNDGNYEIRFYNSSLAPVQFTVPQKMRGIYNLPETLFTH